MFESTNRNGSVALTCLKQTSRKLKEFMLQNKLELMSGVTDVLQNFCLVMFFVFSLKTYSKVLTWHGSTTKRAMGKDQWMALREPLKMWFFEKLNPFW